MHGPKRKYITAQFCIYVATAHVSKVNPLAGLCVKCITEIRVFQNYSDPKLSAADMKEEQKERKFKLLLTLASFIAEKMQPRIKDEERMKTKIATTKAKKNFK